MLEYLSFLDYNLKLDIYLLNLLGKEKNKVKGANHINGGKADEIEYLKNLKFPSIENKRARKDMNMYTCNVYLESL